MAPRTMTVTVDLRDALAAIDGAVERAQASVPHMVAEIDRLTAEIERVRVALARLLACMTDRGSIGGVDSHLRTTWFTVAEVERLRANAEGIGR